MSNISILINILHDLRCSCHHQIDSPVYNLCLAMLIISYVQICLPCILAAMLIPVFCFCMPCLIRVLARAQESPKVRYPLCLLSCFYFSLHVLVYPFAWAKYLSSTLVNFPLISHAPPLADVGCYWRGHRGPAHPNPNGRLGYHQGRG